MENKLIENLKKSYAPYSKFRVSAILVTKDGKEYTKQTVARLFSAECDVFKSWTEDEIHQYLSLMEKYNDGFRKQIEKM